jgi:hypothetical protein
MMAQTIHVETIYEAPRCGESRPKRVGFTSLPTASDLLAVLRRWATTRIETLIASRRQQAERDVARWLQLQGGTITDSMEREIERRWLRL